MDKINKKKNKSKPKHQKLHDKHINKIDEYINDDFIMKQTEAQTSNYQKQLKKKQYEQKQFETNYLQLMKSMEIVNMMGLGSMITSKEFLNLNRLYDMHNPGILRPPTYKQTNINTKTQTHTYTYTDADIATLEQLKQLMDKIMSNNSKSLELKKNIMSSTYDNSEFKKLVSEFIVKQNELDKMTEECRQIYDSFIKLSKYSYNFDQKTEEIKDKLSYAISLYQQILKIKDSIIQLLSNKLNEIKEKVKNFKSLYDNTTRAIKEMLDDTFNLDAITILEQRIKYIINDENSFEPLVKYNSMMTQITNFGTSDIQLMSNGLITMEDNSFVDDNLDEIIEWNEVILDHSEGAYKADKLDLDYFLNTIESSLSDKSIFDFKYFEDWLILLEFDKDDVIRQIRESLQNIDKLCKLDGSHFKYEYSDVSTYLAELYKPDGFKQDDMNNHFVKLLINSAYNNCLGDMMLLSSFYMIIVFFVVIYMSPKNEVKVLDGHHRNHHIYVDLESNFDDLFDENLIINGRDYNGLKNYDTIKTIMDFIMIILLFKFKLMLIIRDELNKCDNLLYYVHRRILLDRDIYLVNENNYNNHNIKQLITYVDDNIIDDLFVLFNDNIAIYSGNDIKERLYYNIISYQQLLYALSIFDASNKGQKDSSLNYALNNGNHTLLSLAINETNGMNQHEYNQDICIIMIYFGLCNIYINDMAKNKINIIMKSCGYVMLLNAGIIPSINPGEDSIYVCFYQYLDATIFDVPNEQNLNVFSGLDQYGICQAIEIAIMNLNWVVIMSLDNGGINPIFQLLNKNQQYIYPDTANGFYDETTILLKKAKDSGVLGDIMILFIYNVIIHLVMFYYSNTDIYVTNGVNDIDIKTENVNSHILFGPVMDLLTSNLYMLLGRFIHFKDYINSNNDINSRQYIIIGNGQDIYDLYNDYNNPIHLFFNDVTTRAFIIDFLNKIHIAYDPILSDGTNADNTTIIAMNEFYIACRQLGALLYGFSNDMSI